MTPQPGLLDPVPPAARFLSFRLAPDADPRAGLGRLAATARHGHVIGLGPSLVGRLERRIPGLEELPSLAGPGVAVPSTPAALWCWLRGDDPGALLHGGRSVARDLGDAFEPIGAVAAFTHAGGRDLTGYEDGTENPTGDRAAEAALVSGRGPGLDGSSFVAVQTWRHDLARFDAMSRREQDLAIGRERSSNAEIGDAPPSAHVRRTAQESFDPPAFVLRRSMPWADATGEGLVFVAFGRSLAPFLAQLRRMVGLEDGVTDGLFRFTRPVTGSAFWCPPTAGGRLDLSALGL